jgi:hypothetical protein
MSHLCRTSTISSMIGWTVSIPPVSYSKLGVWSLRAYVRSTRLQLQLLERGAHMLCVEDEASGRQF